MIRVSGQSKSRPVKAAGAESGGQRRNQKLHAAVAKSTFWSENVQNTSGSGALFEVWCRKNARRCGEKHILKCTPKHFLAMSKNCTPLWRKAHLKWKCWKTDVFGALFEVLMSKNCTPLWRKAHLEVKMLKNCSLRSTFWSSDVEKLHAAVAKSTFGSENVKKLKSSEHFLKFWCRKLCIRSKMWQKSTFYVANVKMHVAKSTLASENVQNMSLRSTFWSSDVEKLHAAVAKAHLEVKMLKNGALFEVQMSKNCTPLWRKAHLSSENVQNMLVRSTFWSSDVEKLVR